MAKGKDSNVTMQPFKDPDSKGIAAMGAHNTRVRDFLDSLDPGNSIIRIGEVLADSVNKDPAIAALIKDIHSRVPSPLVESEALNQFQRLRGTGPRLEIPNVGDVETLLLATLHAIAQANLQRGDIEMFRGTNLKKNLKLASQRADELLNPQFLGELLVETQIQAAKDTVRARKLTEAASAIRGAIPSFEAQLQRANKALDAVCVFEGKPCGWLCWILVVIIIIIVVIVITL